jgi:hypothetical protein
MLEYSLHDNPLTKRPDDLAARVHVKRSYNKEEFIDLMLQRGTTTTRTDLVAVLNNIEETVAYITRDGGTVHLPLFHTGFGITGIFEGAMDNYDPARHALHAAVNPGPLLQEAAREVKLVKVHDIEPHPLVLEVKDSTTGKSDTVLTPNGAVEINGTNIKIIQSADTMSAVWFVKDDDSTRYPAQTLVMNDPSRVIAMIPALPKGFYRVRITTRYSGGSVPLKEPRTTTYGKLLEVE